MNKLIFSLIVSSLLLFGFGLHSPGVVFEIEVKDHEQSPARVSAMEVQVEGRNIAIPVLPDEEGKGSGKMIFKGDRGDKGELIITDDERKEYYVMDPGMFSGMQNQLQEQMKALTKDMDETQRKAIMDAMKNSGSTPTPPAVQRPKRELKKTSERGTKSGYPCIKFEVFNANRQKIQELWVTDWDNIDGGDEAEAAFEDMAVFFQEMMEAAGEMFGGENGNNPMDGYEEVFVSMKELGGFPVVTKEFDDDGSLEGESTLRSSRRRTLDPADFEPPAGYKRRSMGPQ